MEKDNVYVLFEEIKNKPNPQPEQPEGYPDDYLRKKKKKKQRKIRW